MSGFRIPVLAIAVLIASCGDAAPATPPTPATAPVSVPSATTVPAPPPSFGPVDYALTGCEAPPVSFALLCDVYEQLAENHVDAPLDPQTLAAGLAVGVEAFEGTGTGDVLDTFRCAVPDPAFESSCQIISRRLAASPFSIEAAVEAGVASMITLSLDAFTYYIPPELSGAFTPDGVVAAVGLLLTIADAAGSACTVIEPPCRLEVVVAIHEGPGRQAGLEAGDTITAVNGQEVAGATLVEVAGRLDGESGTSVSVDVEREAGTTDTVIITRNHPVFPDLEIETPRPGVGYLRIPDFAADMPGIVHGALQSMADSGFDDLVIDLRDNPGGLVDAVTLVASEFLDDGLVLRSLGPAGDLDYPVQPGGVATSGIDITVVVNAGSASASEILAGVLQERGRAIVVGTPTFGKNTIQIGFPLRNDGELRVTIARWVTPEGASVAVGGVTPDKVIEIPDDASVTDVVDLALNG